MISEGQARALLDECEAALGRRLEILRSQLLRADDVLGPLWELITLYTAMHLGHGVDHQPAEGDPDVLVALNGTEAFWIESTHITWPERDAAAAISSFIDWVRRELDRRYAVQPNTYDIRIDPPRQERNATIPHEHLWASLRRTQNWQQFAEMVRSRKPPIAVSQLPPPFKAVITIRHYDKPQRGLSAGYLAPQVIQRISDHPVWRALRSKGAQARARKVTTPLLVCVGSSLSVSLFESLQHSVPGTNAAVMAALYDTSKWPDMSQYNRLRDTSGRRYQVRGSRLISGVLLVSIESAQHMLWTPLSHNRMARSMLVINKDALYPLSDPQLRSIASLNFNSIPYGPQWETWTPPSRREWKSAERIMSRSEPGKSVIFTPRGDGSFDLAVPAEDLVKILAGTLSIERLLESIRGIHAHNFISRLPPIERAVVLPGDPKQRKPAMLKLSFGPPLERIIHDLRPERGSRRADEPSDRK